MCPHFSVPALDEFGSYHDNLASFEQATAQLAVGRRVEAWARCCRLRAHILDHGEPKSVRWLLPRIEEALKLL